MSTCFRLLPAGDCENGLSLAAEALEHLPALIHCFVRCEHVLFTVGSLAGEVLRAASRSEMACPGLAELSVTLDVCSLGEKLLPPPVQGTCRPSAVSAHTKNSCAAGVCRCSRQLGRELAGGWRGRVAGARRGRA